MSAFPLPTVRYLSSTDLLNRLMYTLNYSAVNNHRCQVSHRAMLNCPIQGLQISLKYIKHMRRPTLKCKLHSNCRFHSASSPFIGSLSAICAPSLPSHQVEAAGTELPVSQHKTPRFRPIRNLLLVSRPQSSNGHPQLGSAHGCVVNSTAASTYVHPRVGFIPARVARWTYC